MSFVAVSLHWNFLILGSPKPEFKSYKNFYKFDTRGVDQSNFLVDTRIENFRRISKDLKKFQKI